MQRRTILISVAVGTIAFATVLFVHLSKTVMTPGDSLDASSSSAASNEANARDARLPADGSAGERGSSRTNEADRDAGRGTQRQSDRDAGEGDSWVAIPGAPPGPELAVVVEGDFPPFVAELADTFGKGSFRPGGCKSPFALLREMAAEQRQDLWADRVERELRELARWIIPESWQLSVGCRASICQVIALEAEPFNDPGRNYWVRFELAVASYRFRDDFASWRHFGAQAPSQPDRIVSGVVMTSRGHFTDEPERCQTPLPALHGT